MKKICVLFILLLVGCSKKIDCTKNNVSVLISSNKITITEKFKNDEEANNYCTLLKMMNVEVQCNENLIIYKNYEDYLNRNFDNSEELEDYLKNDGFICK